MLGERKPSFAKEGGGKEVGFKSTRLEQEVGAHPLTKKEGVTTEKKKTAVKS